MTGAPLAQTADETEDPGVRHSRQAPVFCARQEDFDIWFEGHGWDLPRPDAMMAGQENSRYADICGEDIAAMADSGWHFIAEPVCFTATREGMAVIASAWAAPMRTEDGHTGCNLSYAVDQRYEGRSLAKILTSLAFLASAQVHQRVAFANVECRAGNLPSIALARSLGLAPYPDGDFTMPLSGTTEEAAFLCFRASPGVVRHAAYQTLHDKNLRELLGLIKAARQQR